ncbi:ABC transporter substrate-binding protein [Sphingomonas sp. AOB5]|uniref:ABC transporter substrate-binding protein n=1 Tax=Sphingomonas sp. AOB5 TaxID=3034017 RepID=UPI0023F7FEF2|nr:ABC transporter substrate-binding protein [Sphingomonas sp. AOB5]MDF7777088.1 ABC transporter substrate-binding protein [Sphingomonas sp. AOB5]
MIRAILPLLLVLGGCAPSAPSAGGGIVSTNPCADQMLLALVPPERIAAISHYSQDPGATSIPLDVARRFRTTTGTAEEVIALQPELVVASSFTPPATRAAYERAGLKMLYLDSPVTIAGSKAQIVELAKAVGAAPRGAELVAQIDAAVAAVRPGRARPAALLFIAGDLVNGGGTLLDEMLITAGFRDAAADYGLMSTGTLPVETIVSRPPAVILIPDGGGRTAALRRRVLKTSGATVVERIFPRSLINCGGPTIPAALARLTEIRGEFAR